MPEPDAPTQPLQLTQRVIAFSATPILPVLLFYRMFKRISAGNRLRSELIE